MIMKTSGLIIRTKKILLFFTSAMMIFSFSSCVVTKPFLTSSKVPAARGTVKVKTDHNKNYVIKIELIKLAEVERLEPKRNTYVVWMVTEDNITKNIGQIESSTSFLSKTLKASFQTKSSFKPAKIFLTADYDANIQYPSSEVIITTEHF
jgi:hypothetical protein